MFGELEIRGELNVVNFESLERDLVIRGWGR